MSGFRKTLSVLLALMLLALCIGPAAAATSGEEQRPAPPTSVPALVYYDESLDLDGLGERLGITVTEDYGGFALAELTPGQHEWLDYAGVSVETLSDISMLYLRSGAFDTRNGEPPLPPKLTGPGTGEGWYLIQHIGPIKDSWMAKFESMGGEVVGYVPNYAHIAYLGAGVSELVATWPEVRWVGAYHPAYRLDPGLVDGQYTVIFFPGRATETLDLLKQTGLVVISAEGDSAIVQGTNAQAEEAATLTGVEFIEQYKVPELSNDVARMVIRSDIPHSKGINGRPTNQRIAITDTGIWWPHQCFSEAGKIAAFIDIAGDSGVSQGDGHGHGTHVAGSALGDAPNGGVYLTYNLHDGQAFGARAVAVKVFNNAGWWVGGNNYYNIWSLAYQQGARVNNNSWGSASWGAYGASDHDADHITWDNREYVLAIAAGNSGAGGPNSTGSPANAKNVITVGATETAAPENVAGFSSRGPTDDSRIKPDVMAPGNPILSAQRGVVNGYVNMSGTSMATPQVSGSAALVREYFMRGFYPTGAAVPGNAFTPRAALVKAILVNGAQEMTGLRSDWNNEGRWPNNAQGWGRINLDRSLYFTNDARRLVVWDNPANLPTGASWTGRFNVGDGTQDVKVTLAWTDYPANAGAQVTLINNLNLRVIAPDGSVFLGNNFVNRNPGYSVTGGAFNNRDTVEGVHLVPNRSFPGNLPLGQYRVIVTAANMPRQFSNFGVAVSGSVFTPPVVPSRVALMGDYNSFLKNFLEGVGYTVQTYGGDEYAAVIANLASHEVVVLNKVTNVPAFDTLLSEVARLQKGIVFCGTYPVSGSGMGVLQARAGDPSMVNHNWGLGPVRTGVLANHPIFNGYLVGQQVTLINGGDNDYQTYNGYSGADLGSNLMDIQNPFMIGAKDRTQTGGARHAVMGSMGSCVYTNTRHWTADGQRVFINAVEWCAGNGVPPALRARVAVMGDYNNQISGYLTSVGYRVTRYASADYAGVIANINNLDAVLLHQVSNAVGFDNLLATAAATQRGLVFMSSWPVLGYGMGVLRQRFPIDLPTVNNSYGAGPVRFSVAAVHPVLAGYAVGRPVTMLNGGANDYQTFDGYTGTTIGASLMPLPSPRMIGVKDRAQTGGARHVVMGSFGACIYTNFGAWTPDAKQILKNAIEWSKFGAP